ncbi:MAG: glucokinase [Rhizobiales bacterium]|nr:glucokinase [Hyphomicrobiales bacterium]
MAEVLLADIGATNCRFAVIGADGRPARMIKLRDNEVPTLEAGIARYLEETGAQPRAGVLAIAGPIDGDAVKMTNRNWAFRFGDLAKRFGWSGVRGINDFEAVAWSLPHLAAGDVRALGTLSVKPQGVKAAFGPGTGLGVAALLPESDGWRVVATEGGHVSFGPATDEEEAVFARLRAKHGRVSAETVLCGPGIENLFSAMNDGAERSSADIIAAANAGEAAAVRCVKLFVRLFGRFAGDLALTFKALGGIYVGGGVSRRVAKFLDAPAFREAFENHPPYADLLRRIPTTLITLDEPGLLGCAAVARAEGFV